MTLFFVMVAFFAASAVITRAHYEARASVIETVSIQQEALARSALVTLQGKLDQAGTEEDAPTVELSGPGGLKAITWIEKENDEVFRLCAKVEGGMGQPFLAQKIVRKKPVLTALDLAHLTDGDIATADHIRLRLADADTWTNLPAPKSSMMWVNVDRRGNIFANHFPVLGGEIQTSLPTDFVASFVKKNDEYLRQGKINFQFLKQAAQALEDNRDLDLNVSQVGIPNGGFGPNMGEFGGDAAIAMPVQPEFSSELVKPTHEVATAFADGASIRHYSPEKGVWERISIDLPPGPHLPGRTCSDGKKVYLPILQPGEDSLRSYELKSKTWEVLPQPSRIERTPEGLLVSGKGASTKILNVEVNDDGDLFCHHGDGEDFTVSRFDAQSNTWEILPPPPGLYAGSSGTTKSVINEAKAWGNMAVDGEGDVFVVWRPAQEPEVHEYQATHGPLEEPFFSQFSSDLSFAVSESGGILQSFNPWVAKKAPEKVPSVVPGGSPGAPKPPPVAPKAPPVAVVTTSPETVTLRPGHPSRMGPLQDVLLSYTDGSWGVVAPKSKDFLRIGSVSTSIEGRLVIQNIKPFGPDELMTLDTDGQLGEPSTVPDTPSSAAEFFAFDSGGQPVDGRYRFQETAEY